MPNGDPRDGFFYPIYTLMIIRIYYECEGGIEQSVPRDNSLSSLGKPRDAKRRSSGQIFLSNPHTNNGFLFLLTTVFKKLIVYLLIFLK